MPNRSLLTQPRSLLAYAYPLACLQTNPYYYSRMNESAGRGILNLVTGQIIANAYSASGFTYGVAGGFSGDPSTAIQDNGAGFVTLPFVTAQRSEFSLVARIRLPTANCFGYAMHVGTRNTGYGFGIGNGTVDGGGTQFVGVQEGLAWIATSFNLTVGVFHHCAMIETGGSVYMYVDGSLVYNAVIALPTAPAANNFIGCDDVGRNSNFIFSDCAFYNYGLSSTQVANLALLAN